VTRRRRFVSWLLDLLCALLAYMGARWIWRDSPLFSQLHFELLTFAALYVLLEALVRGRRLARQGKSPQ
jgi:hypothetical protein